MEKEFESTMFADDATLVMDGSLKSFQTLYINIKSKTKCKQNYHFESGLIEKHKYSTLRNYEILVDFS